LAFHSGREADHSPPSSTEAKECGELYLHSPNTPSWLVALLKAQEPLHLYHLDQNFALSILLWFAISFMGFRSCQSVLSKCDY
jgi:hypothetical protein